jgi:septum site-determining protein MinD
MRKLCKALKEEFEYVVIDCPAGIEQGFKNAIAGADKAVVVTTPEVSAVRDADRVIGLLEASDLKNPLLVLNRIRPDMVRRGDMMTLDDVTEILAIDILGVVPDDESIVISTNRGEPCVADDSSRAGKAYRNITRRLLGEIVPLMKLQQQKGLFGRIAKFLRLGY